MDVWGPPQFIKSRILFAIFCLWILGPTFVLSLYFFVWSFFLVKSVLLSFFSSLLSSKTLGFFCVQFHFGLTVGFLVKIFWESGKFGFGFELYWGRGKMGYVKWEVFFTGLVLIFTSPFSSALTDSLDGKVDFFFFFFLTFVLLCLVLGKVWKENVLKLLPLPSVFLSLASLFP